MDFSWMTLELQSHCIFGIGVQIGACLGSLWNFITLHLYGTCTDWGLSWMTSDFQNLRVSHQLPTSRLVLDDQNCRTYMSLQQERRLGCLGRLWNLRIYVFVR